MDLVDEEHESEDEENESSSDESEDEEPRIEDVLSHLSQAVSVKRASELLHSIAASKDIYLRISALQAPLWNNTPRGFDFTVSQLRPPRRLIKVRPTLLSWCWLTTPHISRSILAAYLFPQQSADLSPIT